MGVTTYNLIFASGHVGTDNAYVDADVAQVTALTAGPVQEVRVVDTQAVKKGDVLVVLDDTDRRLDLQQAQASLATDPPRVAATRRPTCRCPARSPRARRTWSAPRPNSPARQAEYDRRAPLAGSGAVSGEELTSVKTQLDAAKAAYAQAEANIQAAQGAREAEQRADRRRLRSTRTRRSGPHSSGSTRRG